MTPAIYTYGFGIDGEPIECFLAAFTDTPCGGRMERAHLIPKQLIRRELRTLGIPRDEITAAVWDERAWRPACRYHHRHMDMVRDLRIPREGIPADTEQYAAQYGIEWWLTREYGPLEAAA